ncbi:MAG TPA: LysE family transporter [Bacteroidales bacterium]|jgi:threonine/homoserine/homoserine lactone efflux protein|nr:LysE family transporter [Bacteroidales bacterium]HPE40720.1 LysE family transporter [Bacteroidales bacterium]
MELSILLKGIFLGLCVAVPVGPIGILCINRTINKGYFSGVVSGLGATTADFLYGIVAGLGVTVVSNFLIDYKNWLHLIGLIFLIIVGINIIVKKQKDPEMMVPESKGFFKDYVTSFLLTLTNPLTIFFFIAVFASLNLSSDSKFDAIPLLLGVLIGSGGWWFILCGFTQKFKKRLGFRILKKIDLISGLLILVFSLYVAYSLLKEIL